MSAYPRQMTHADRVFLNDCGVFLHLLNYRDGYYWKAKERRESGEDKREFAELLKEDWAWVRTAEKAKSGRGRTARARLTCHPDTWQPRFISRTYVWATLPVSPTV